MRNATKKQKKLMIRNAVLMLLSVLTMGGVVLGHQIWENYEREHHPKVIDNDELERYRCVRDNCLRTDEEGDTSLTN